MVLIAQCKLKMCVFVFVFVFFCFLLEILFDFSFSTNTLLSLVETDLPLNIHGTVIEGTVSFQEEDLNCVRERWSEALSKRREYLDEQIKKIMNKHGMS